MWGRFSGSNRDDARPGLRSDRRRRPRHRATDRDTSALSTSSLRVDCPRTSAAGASGPDFYPVLYALTRVGDAQDVGHWARAQELAAGRMNALEVHGTSFEGTPVPLSGLPAVAGQRRRELLLPDEGHEPADQRPRAGRVLRGDRGASPRRARVAMDPDEPGFCGRRKTTRDSLRSASACLPRPQTSLLNDLLHDAPAIESGEPVSGGCRNGQQAVPRSPAVIEDAEEDGCPPGHQRLGTQPGTATEGHDRARTCTLRIPATRSPSSTLPGRTACNRATASRWRCCSAEEQDDTTDRERPRVPPLHERRGVQAVRGDRSAGAGTARVHRRESGSAEPPTDRTRAQPADYASSSPC